MMMNIVSCDALPEEAISDWDLLLRDWSPETSALLADISNYEYMQKLKKALRRCIREDLTPKQREVVVMYWFKGMTQEQIAEKLGIGHQRISKRLKYAYKKIYKKLLPIVENGGQNPE